MVYGFKSEEDFMEKQKVIFGIIAMLLCSVLLISGCTQEQESSNGGTNNNGQNGATETIQTILAKAETIQSMYYEVSTTTTITGAPEQTGSYKIWQKLPYMKEEVTTTTGDVTTSLSIIKRPEGIYMYDATQGMYILSSNIEIPQSSAADTSRDILNNQTITELGTETIDGKATTVIQYTVTTEQGSTTVKMWIWNEKGVPLKSTFTMTTEQISMTQEYIYSNYSFADIPDSTFDVS